MKKNISLGLLILRLVTGILMLLHGINKITHGVGGIGEMLTEKGIPEFIAYGVLIGEVLAPALLIVGYRTRIAALVFAFNCLIALLLVHLDDVFTLTKHGGWASELLGLYFFGSIALFFTGGGEYALSSKSNWD